MLRLDLAADGDLLNSREEALFGTSDATSDTDNDLLPDQFELLHFANLPSQDAYGTPDNDPLTNIEEYQLRLNPNLDKTDGLRKDGHGDEDNDCSAPDGNGKMLENE